MIKNSLDWFIMKKKIILKRVYICNRSYIQQLEEASKMVHFHSQIFRQI